MTAPLQWEAAAGRRDAPSPRGARRRRRWGASARWNSLALPASPGGAAGAGGRQGEPHGPHSDYGEAKRSAGRPARAKKKARGATRQKRPKGPLSPGRGASRPRSREAGGPRGDPARNPRRPQDTDERSKGNRSEAEDARSEDEAGA